MIKATFISHSVKADGLHIYGISGLGLTPDIEIFIPRGEAEAFDWIDPDCGSDEEYEVDAAFKAKQHVEELAKLREWNSLARSGK